MLTINGEPGSRILAAAGRVLAVEGRRADAAEAADRNELAPPARITRALRRGAAEEFNARAEDARGGYYHEGGPAWVRLMMSRWAARPAYLPGARHGDPCPAFVPAAL